MPGARSGRRASWRWAARSSARRRRSRAWSASSSASARGDAGAPGAVARQAPGEDRARGARPARGAALAFAFEAPERSGRVVFELEDGRSRCRRRTLLEGAELWLERGEHVSLVGPNGAGKTTLIETLAGRRPLAAGKLRRGHNVRSASSRSTPSELGEPGPCSSGPARDRADAEQGARPAGAVPVLGRGRREAGRGPVGRRAAPPLARDPGALGRQRARARRADEPPRPREPRGARGRAAARLPARCCWSRTTGRCSTPWGRARSRSRTAAALLRRRLGGVRARARGARRGGGARPCRPTGARASARSHGRSARAAASRRVEERAARSASSSGRSKRRRRRCRRSRTSWPIPPRGRPRPRRRVDGAPRRGEAGGRGAVCALRARRRIVDRLRSRSRVAPANARDSVTKRSPPRHRQRHIAARVRAYRRAMTDLTIHRTRAPAPLAPPAEGRPLGGRLGLDVPQRDVADGAGAQAPRGLRLRMDPDARAAGRHAGRPGERATARGLPAGGARADELACRDPRARRAAARRAGARRRVRGTARLRGRRRRRVRRLPRGVACRSPRGRRPTASRIACSRRSARCGASPSRAEQVGLMIALENLAPAYPELPPAAEPRTAVRARPRAADRARRPSGMAFDLGHAHVTAQLAGAALVDVLRRRARRRRAVPRPRQPRRAARAAARRPGSSRCGSTCTWRPAAERCRGGRSRR